MTTTLLLAAVLTPVLAVFVVAAFRDPLRYALPPYVVSTPFSSVVAVGPGPFGSVSSLLGLLLGAALVAQLMTTRRGSPRIPVEVPVWSAFLALCGLSLFWSIVPGVTAFSFAVLASLVLLFVALALTRFDRAALKRYENAVVLSGVLAVCYGIVQLLIAGGFATTDTGVARFGSDLLDQNNQASALLLPLAITAGRTLTESGTRRLVHGLTTALLVIGILMTGSRGGLLAAVVVLVAVLALTPTRRVTKVVVAASAVTLLTSILLTNPADIGRRQVEATDSSGRSDIWAVGLHACPEYCLGGAGWGGFPTVYREELPSVPEASMALQGYAYEPHNIFLLAGIEAGVLGLLLVTIGLGVALAGALRLPRWMRGTPSAAMLGGLVSSFFLSNLEYKFFWVLLAYVTICKGIAVAEREVERHVALSGR